MEEFFSNLPLKKILAGIVVAALIFSGFYKEDFLYSKTDKEALDNLSNKTNNKLSGKTITAIIYFIITIIALVTGLLIYKN